MPVASSAASTSTCDLAFQASSKAAGEGHAHRLDHLVANQAILGQLTGRASPRREPADPLIVRLPQPAHDQGFVEGHSE